MKKQLKNQKQLMVTIAISAYNEEKNILPLLKSILLQNTKKFNLKRILLVSDGSVDKTNEYVKKLENKKVQLIAFKNRKGKSSRLNYIYNIVTTDILIQFDADVILMNKYILQNLVEQFVKDKNLMMVGGNARPIKGKSFVENAVNCTTNAYQVFRRKINNGNNPFTVDGRIIGYRKKLYKSIHIPKNMIANDRFTYYTCLSKNMKYVFVPNAVVNYRSPVTIRDHVKQNIRFIAANTRMHNYFDKELLDVKSHIPMSLKINTQLKEFVYHPAECLFIFFVNIYCALQAKITEKSLTAEWDIVNSTKSMS